MMNRAEQNWPEDETLEITDTRIALAFSEYVIALYETGSIFEPLYLSEVQ